MHVHIYIHMYIYTNARARAHTHTHTHTEKQCFASSLSKRNGASQATFGNCSQIISVTQYQFQGTDNEFTLNYDMQPAL